MRKTRAAFCHVFPRPRLARFLYRATIMTRTILVCMAVLVCACEKDKTVDTTQTTSAAPADNTKTNSRDKSGVTPTPIDQSNAAADLNISAQIRKQLMADDSLSSDAKNVKVITRDGTVVLRGTVKSDAEKANVEAKAVSVAGMNRVDNELDVAAK